MTDRTIAYTPLDAIPREPRNPKGHAPELIRSSIDVLGFIEPIVIDERTGKLVSGHGRLDELQRRREAGETPPDGITVDGQGGWLAPVVRGWASNDDDDAARAVVVLNRAVEAGGWQPESLAEVLVDLARTDVGLTATGFADTDLALLLDALDPGIPVAEHLRNRPDPDQPSVPDNPVTQRGDVWLLGPHRVMCGDCRDAADVARLLGDRQVNLAVTSPPYAEQREYDEGSGFVPIPPAEYVDWFAPVAENVAAHLADDGSWLVNIKPPAAGLDVDLYVFDLVVAHVRQWGWHLAYEYCWERNGVPKSPTLRLKNQFEPVYQFTRARWRFRPDNVKHKSPNAIVPLGAGRAGDTSWKGAHGQGGDLFERNKRPNAGLDRSMAAAQGGSGPPLIYPEQHRASRKRPHGGGSFTEEYQGTNWQPGEALGDGWAYPGNRLPNFVGSHEATGHPAAFPVGLPAFLTLLFTDHGDHVYDPFVGSGSSILAAHQNDRVGFGMELSPGYCDVAASRFQRSTGIVPVLERTGEAVSLVLDT